MESEYSFNVILGTISILLLLTVGIIGFMLLYLRKVSAFKLELHKKELAYKQSLLDSVIRAQELERQRIGSDIHDDIGSTVAFCTLALNRIIDNMDEANHDRSQATRLLDSLNELLDRVRKISKNLFPSILMDFGLVDALEAHCKSLNDTTPLQVTMNTDGKLIDLPQQTELAIFRIFQEFSSNTVKHAQATALKLDIRNDTKELKFIMSDNGKGIPPEIGANAGLGVKNMHARAASINARFTLESDAKYGGTIGEITIVTEDV